jgi:hypothetical protein
VRQALGWHDAGGLDWKREWQWGKVLGRSSDGPIYRGEGTGSVQQQPDPNLQLNSGFGERTGK